VIINEAYELEALNLHGLPLAGLRIDAGENDYAVHFASPNPAHGGSATVSLGSGSFHATGLLNSRFNTLRVQTKKGGIHVAFDGLSLEHTMTVHLHSCTGDILIKLPEHIPARIIFRTVTGTATASADHFLPVDSTIYETGSYHRLDSPHIEFEVDTLLGDLRLTGI